MTTRLLDVQPVLSRRPAVRYRLRLPVIFRWNDGAEHMDGGFTSNIAIDGALVVSGHCPPLGSTVRMEVLLPSPDQDDEEVRIMCIGRVTRVAGDCAFNSFDVRGIFNDVQSAVHPVT
jgi:hypothetical protein